jgi:hypothetical protein
MTDKLYIICSAVWYKDHETYPNQPKNIETGIVSCGLRHCNCFPLLYEMYPPIVHTHEEVQGFLTSQNTFVDRFEALKIATEAGQLVGREKHSPEDRLMSEDIY